MAHRLSHVGEEIREVFAKSSLRAEYIAYEFLYAHVNWGDTAQLEPNLALFGLLVASSAKDKVDSPSS